ncbi:DsbA family protein [Myxococcota bacterium]|nr:DsbA family protein [Myxococcota bacterium]MBU1536738.1 DsbA family protein [Myxococcota bacterium]
MKKLCFVIIVWFMVLPGFARGNIPWGRVMGADTSSLSAADKKKAASLMGEINSYYGCSDSVAKCLKTAPGCLTARHIAGHIVRMVQKGRSEKEIKRAVMLRAKSAHPFKKHKIKPNKAQCIGDPDKAALVIYGYSDFQCPFCTIVLPRLEAMVKKRSNVALCFKNFPTLAHGSETVVASIAAVAASMQGKFWAYHNILYKNRKNQSRSELIEYAKKIGLDMERFKKDFSSRKAKKIVAREKQEGLSMKVKGTPTLFFNGKMYFGRKDAALLSDRMDEELFLSRGKK